MIPGLLVTRRVGKLSLGQPERRTETAGVPVSRESVNSESFDPRPPRLRTLATCGKSPARVRVRVGQRDSEPPAPGLRAQTYGWPLALAA